MLGVNLADESEPMGSKDASKYRAMTARFHYLPQAIFDIQHAGTEASRRMSKPCQRDWQLMERIGHYLLGAPRFVQLFEWQSMPSTVDAFTNSDWTGCNMTCLSMRGGVIKWGRHWLKSWSSTQATIALSSAEAELFAVTQGAAEALGMMTLIADFGISLYATVHTDASAAIGIVRRTGLAKLRRLNVRYLCFQE